MSQVVKYQVPEGGEGVDVREGGSRWGPACSKSFAAPAVPLVSAT